MAKRNKPDDADDGSYDFIPPDFDEDAFIHKEMVSFRTTTVLFAWGILAALVSWMVFANLDGARAGWFIGLAICAGFGYALKFLYPALKIDIAHFERREWMGTGFLFFFTWLAFFILVVNPPVSDYADPQVYVLGSPPVQQVGSPVDLHLFGLDNDAVAAIDFTLTQGGNTVATTDDLTRDPDGRYRFTQSLIAGTYSYTFGATDKGGRTATATGDLQVSSKALRYGPPRDNELANAAEQLTVEAGATVPLHRVYLDPVGGGPDINLTYNGDLGAWTAGPKTCGLSTGTHQFAIVGEANHAFIGPHFVPGGTIRVPGPFNVTVTYEMPPGDACNEAQYKAQNTQAPTVQVPTVPLPALLVGVLALAAVVGRRR